MKNLDKVKEILLKQEYWLDRLEEVLNVDKDKRGLILLIKATYMMIRIQILEWKYKRADTFIEDLRKKGF